MTSIIFLFSLHFNFLGKTILITLSTPFSFNSFHGTFSLIPPSTNLRSWKLHGEKTPWKTATSSYCSCDGSIIYVFHLIRIILSCFSFWHR